MELTARGAVIEPVVEKTYASPDAKTYSCAAGDTAAGGYRRNGANCSASSASNADITSRFTLRVCTSSSG